MKLSGAGGRGYHRPSRRTAPAIIMPDLPAKRSAPRSEALWDRRPTAADRLLAAAAGVERSLRAVWRRLWAGEKPWRGEDRRRLAAATGGAAPEAGQPEASPPLLYLPALPWAERFQRPQQLAAALARAGPAVLWMEAFLRTRLQPAVWVEAPRPRLRVVRLPLPGRPDPFRQPFPPAAAGRIAATLLAGLPTPPIAVLVQLPFWAPLGYELRHRTGAPLVYDRIDLHTGFPGVPAAVGETEAELIRRADLITCTSPYLAAASRATVRGPDAAPDRRPPPVALLPNAADPALFTPAPYRPSGAEGDEGGDRPTAGFAGALDERIDVAAIAAAAGALDGWRFRLAGRVEHPSAAELATLPNVELLGEIPHSEVPAFLASLDIGLVPYRDTPLTRAIDPVKLYEMLAAGLPVVRRVLPATSPEDAADGFDDGGFDGERTAPEPPLVYPYRDAAELTETLCRARREDSADLHRRRAERATEETWDHRANALLRRLSGLAQALC